MSQPNRNQPCPCGSGKRYKQCCGSLASGNGAAAPAPAGVEEADLAALMAAALAAHTAKQYQEAEKLYRRVIGRGQASFDALHMLGVVRLQLGDPEEASRLLLAALPLVAGNYPPYLQNLGLCLAALAKARPQGNGPDRPQAREPGTAGDASHLHFHRQASLAPIADGKPPAVSVAIPWADDDDLMAESIASLGRQTYRHVDLLLVGTGGSGTASPRARQALDGCRFPHRWVACPDPATHAQLNAAIEASDSRFVGILEPGDRYAPHRIESLVRMLEASQLAWGFSNLRYLGPEGQPLSYGQHRHADRLMKLHDQLYLEQCLSGIMQRENVAVTVGNLFFRRELWRDAGGFRETGGFGCWAFCLDALPHAEPGYLDEASYEYAIHARGDEDAANVSVRQDRLAAWRAGLAGQTSFANPHFVLEQPRMSAIYAADLAAMAAGRGHQIGRERLLRFAGELGLGVNHA